MTNDFMRNLMMVQSEVMVAADLMLGVTMLTTDVMVGKTSGAGGDFLSDKPMLATVKRNVRMGKTNANADESQTAEMMTPGDLMQDLTLGTRDFPTGEWRMTDDLMLNRTMVKGDTTPDETSGTEWMMKNVPMLDLPLVKDGITLDETSSATGDFLTNEITVNDDTKDKTIGIRGDFPEGEMKTTDDLRPNLRMAKGDFPHTHKVMTTDDLLLNLEKMRGDLTLDGSRDEVPETASLMLGMMGARDDVSLTATYGVMGNFSANEAMMTANLLLGSTMKQGVVMLHETNRNVTMGGTNGRVANHPADKMKQPDPPVVQGDVTKDTSRATVADFLTLEMMAAGDLMMDLTGDPRANSLGTKSDFPANEMEATGGLMLDLTKLSGDFTLDETNGTAGKPLPDETMTADDITRTLMTVEDVVRTDETSGTMGDFPTD